MLNLQRLVDRLVDDVLRALRRATLDELGDLVSEAAGPSRPSRPRESAPARPRQTARAARDARAEPPHRGDITDPEALLSSTKHGESPAATPFPPEEMTQPHVERSRRSTLRPGPMVPTQLRSGESVARQSKGGVVIRRAKKATTSSAT